jgi:hypothetical protein
MMTEPRALSEDTSSAKEDRIFLVGPFAPPSTERQSAGAERKLRLLAGGKPPAGLRSSALAAWNLGLACVAPARRLDKVEALAPWQSPTDAGFHFLESLGIKVILES